MKKLKFKTVILSDVHLGALHCRVQEASHFLKNVQCERLILNGDIIDGWELRRAGGWTREHTRFVRLALKKAEKEGSEVIYLRGNHDDMLGRFLPIAFDKIRIQESYTLNTASGRFFVFHGDVLDAVTMNFAFVSKLGSVGYRWLLSLNRLYNLWRRWRGKEYFSLSRRIKARVKAAVNHVCKFEKELIAVARRRKCGGVICGHIHTPADKMLEDVRYLNSGDWVESLTAVVEELDGRLALITYEEFCERLEKLKEKETGFSVNWNPDLPSETAAPLRVTRPAAPAPFAPRR